MVGLPAATLLHLCFPRTRTLRIVLRLSAATALAVSVWLLPTLVRAQQPAFSRYDAYVGFAVIDSPALGLDEHNGFHAQAGMNPRRWLSLGGDYSEASGSEMLTTDLLPAATQAMVNAAQQQYINFGVIAATQTFAFGPQLACRHYSKVTFFLRPSLGALRERAVPHPADAFQTVIVAGLAPAGFKLDWTGFYGIGGGGEVAMNRHFGLRAQMDFVYNHPFNDILANGRWTFRYSVGPSFHWGSTAGKNKK